MRRVNWDGFKIGDVEAFASGKMSANEFYDSYKGTEMASDARFLVRNRRAQYARRTARKALKRRNILVNA